MSKWPALAVRWKCINANSWGEQGQRLQFSEQESILTTYFLQIEAKSHPRILQQHTIEINSQSLEDTQVGTFRKNTL